MPRANGLGIALVAALALYASGCGGGGPTAVTPGREATVANANTQPTATQVEPPKACKQAMAAYYDALVEAGARGSPPNEEALQRATLQSCTRDEWLEAVMPYTKGIYAIAIAAPEDVLDATCGSPRLQAPACS
jgi:hypothetical protein